MKNILFYFFYFLISINLHAQELCDPINADTIFVFTDDPPKSNISLNKLENLLNKNISAKDFEKPLDNMIYLTFTINCKGETFNYKFLRPIDKKLQDKILEVTIPNLKWSPAHHGGVAVDFQKTISIKIENNNKFNVLNENELKKIKHN